MKPVIIIGGVGALAMGFIPLGLALLGFGAFVIIAIRPAEIASEQATEDTSPVIQGAAVGWGALLLVLSIAALAFIINGAMPGGMLR